MSDATACAAPVAVCFHTPFRGRTPRGRPRRTAQSLQLRRVMPDRLWNRLALRAVTPQTASMGLRERACIRADALGPLLRLLRASARASEWLVLATCARTEIYAVSCEGGSASIDDVIAAAILPVRDDEASVPEWPICASGVDAARHLLRVASGVESIVLGDVQLLGQLRTAYAAAQAHQTTGPSSINSVRAHSTPANVREQRQESRVARLRWPRPPSSSPRDRQVAWRCGAS
jgi:Glutamyl-tRNAGlu reductase, N-terminal domain